MINAEIHLSVVRRQVWYCCCTNIVNFGRAVSQTVGVNSMNAKRKQTDADHNQTQSIKITIDRAIITLSSASNTGTVNCSSPQSCNSRQPTRSGRESDQMGSAGLNLGGGGERPGPQASQQQRASHQTVSILLLANDRCLRDYDFVVDNCWSLF